MLYDDFQNENSHYNCKGSVFRQNDIIILVTIYDITLFLAITSIFILYFVNFYQLTLLICYK